MPTIYSQALDDLIDRVSNPPIGYKFRVTATAGGFIATTTDPAINQMGPDANRDEYSNKYLYIPSASLADYKRTIALDGLDVSPTGISTLSTNGPTYSATYTDAVAYLLATDPDFFFNWGNDGLRNRFTDVLYPLAHGPNDAFMGDAGTGAWQTLNATAAKQITPSELFLGSQTMVVTDNGAGGGYAQQAVLDRINQGEIVYFFAIVKADVGTSALVVLDSADNERARVEFSGENWIMIRKRVVFQGGSDEFRVRLLSVTPGAEADWQGVWYVKRLEMLFNLPSWIDHRGNVKAVSMAEFRRVLTGARDTWLAGSLVLQGLNEEADYVFYDYGLNQIHLLDPMRWRMEWPILITVSCPFSSLSGQDTTFSGYNSANPIDQELFVAEWQAQIAAGLNEISSYGRNGEPVYDGEPFSGLQSKGLQEVRRLLPAQVTKRPPHRRWRGPGYIP